MRALLLAMLAALPSAAKEPIEPVPAGYLFEGPLAKEAEEWLANKGRILKPYARDFVRKLAEVAGREGAPMPRIAGMRTTLEQARAMHDNYVKARKQKGEAGGRDWAIDVYGNKKKRTCNGYCKTVLDYFVNIHEKKATFDDWYKYFDHYVKSSGIPSHTNGRAFDVTPKTDKVQALVETAVKEGEEEKLFRRSDWKIEKDHFHVGFSAPVIE